MKYEFKLREMPCSKLVCWLVSAYYSFVASTRSLSIGCKANAIYMLMLQTWL